MHALVLMLLLVAPANAEPEAELRSVYVSMTDEAGNPVTDIRPEEVALLENGVVRDLKRMELDDRPLTVAILLDTSASLGASYRLSVIDPVVRLTRLLPPDSRFGIWTTGERPVQLMDFTDSSEFVEDTLRRVVQRGGNTMLDAVVEVPKELAAAEGERSMVIIISGNGVGFTNYLRQQAAELALKHDTMYYAVLFDVEAGVAYAQGGSEVSPLDYEYVLSEVTERTGGYYRRLLSVMGLGDAVGRLGAQLRGLYRVTYATLPEIKKRKLKVEVARPEVKVRIGVPTVEEE